MVPHSIEDLETRIAHVRSLLGKAGNVLAGIRKEMPADLLEALQDLQNNEPAGHQLSYRLDSSNIVLSANALEKAGIPFDTAQVREGMLVGHVHRIHTGFRMPKIGEKTVGQGVVIDMVTLQPNPGDAPLYFACYSVPEGPKKHIIVSCLREDWKIAVNNLKQRVGAKKPCPDFELRAILAYAR